MKEHIFRWKRHEKEVESTLGEEDEDKIDETVANAAGSGDPSALLAAELEAEAADVDHVDFEAEVQPSHLETAWGERFV
jgi:hypothetical protein